jgi:hypothetical protein
MSTTATTRVSSLTVYPVKSCGGVSVQAATLTETGLRFDRCWMVVKAPSPGKRLGKKKKTKKKKNPPKSMFVSQRSDPKMALVSAFCTARVFDSQPFQLVRFREISIAVRFSFSLHPRHHHHARTKNTSPHASAHR